MDCFHWHLYRYFQVCSFLRRAHQSSAELVEQNFIGKALQLPSIYTLLCGMYVSCRTMSGISFLWLVLGDDRTWRVRYGSQGLTPSPSSLLKHQVLYIGRNWKLKVTLTSQRDQHPLRGCRGHRRLPTTAWRGTSQQRWCRWRKDRTGQSQRSRETKPKPMEYFSWRWKKWALKKTCCKVFD